MESESATHWLADTVGWHHDFPSRMVFSFTIGNLSLSDRQAILVDALAHLPGAQMRSTPPPEVPLATAEDIPLTTIRSSIRIRHAATVRPMTQRNRGHTVSLPSGGPTS